MVNVEEKKGMKYLVGMTVVVKKKLMVDKACINRKAEGD